MDFIRKLLSPHSIPFYKKRGNSKYAEILNFQGVPKNESYSTKRIVQEVRLKNETVVSKLDNTLDYLHINKYGKVAEFNLVKTKFEKSSKKLFERCDESLIKIMELGIPENQFLKADGVRLTFITDRGNYSIFGNLADLEKRIITGQTIVHFLNLVELTTPNGIEKILNDSR